MMETAKAGSKSFVRLVLTLIAALGLLIGGMPAVYAQDNGDAGLAIEDFGPETEIPPVAEDFLETESAEGVSPIEGAESDATEGEVAESVNSAEQQVEAIGDAPKQTADGRTEVWCAPGPPGEVCTPEELVKRIDEAGTTPTRIIVRGTVSMPETLVIPAGADIELVNIDGRNMIITTTRDFKGRVIEVEEGGSLTFSKNESDHLPYVLGQNHWNGSSSILIDVKGTLVLNAGKIYGARNMSGKHQGAITVSGETAYFEMNGGEVSENRRKDDPGTTQNGAANIAVVDGAKMRMNGGVVQKGLAAKKADAYGEVGGIGVYDGGRLEINGGEIRGNTGFAGGVAAYSWDQDLAQRPERSGFQRSIIYLNGGVIDDNHAGFGGGGALVYGNAELIMNGGEITNNTAPNGGGVNVMDLYVKGADGRFHEIPGDGMSAGYTAEAWSKISPGTFIMNGGTIAGNEVFRTGGGVNVVSNGVLLKGGRIADNRAIPSNDFYAQGGGVYVATRSYVLQLENVVVHDNKATAQGGGIWLCPTGSAEVHVTEGGAIFDNSAEVYGDDFAHDNLGTQGRPELELANRMLGFGEVKYYLDADIISSIMDPDGYKRFDPENPGREQVYRGDVKPEDRDPDKDYKLQLFQQGLKQVSTDADRDDARELAALTITGNSSERGGGIGSNGGVIIGYDDQEIPVEKTWIDHSGDEMTEDLPESIEVNLWATYKDENQVSQKKKVGETVEITPDDEGNWFHIFRDLPYTMNGQVVKYSVEEHGVPGFTTIVANEIKDGKISFRIANRQQDTGVTVQKSWLDRNGNEMTEGLPDVLEVALMRWEGDKQVPVYPDDEGNPTYVKLSPDSDPAWSHTFDDLPLFAHGEQIAYDVIEKPVDGFESSTSVTKADDNTYVLNIENREIATDVTVEKQWVGLDGGVLPADQLPEFIELQLLRVDGEDAVEVGEPVTVVKPDRDGNWSHTFENLPKYVGGNLAEYTVFETPVVGFTSDVGTGEDGAITVTNTQLDTEITVEKTWTGEDGVDITDELPESITVSLMRWAGDEKEPVEGHQNVELTAANNGWRHTFDDLPLYIDGELVAYDIDEVSVDGFTQTTSVERTDDGYLLHLENSAESTEITVDKQWRDADGAVLTEGLPESITVQLVRIDGEEVFTVGGPVEITAGEDGTWSYTFTDLAKYFDGELAQYSVVELELPGFISDVERNDSGDVQSVTLTNTATETEIEVNKVWKDATGKNLVDDLPEFIEVEVVQTVGEQETVIGEPIRLNEDGDWSAVVKGLPTHVDEVAAEYSVREREVAGFASTVEVTVKDGRFIATVTNVKEETPPDNPPEDPEEPPVTPPEDPEDPPSWPPVVPPVTPPATPPGVPVPPSSTPGQPSKGGESSVTLRSPQLPTTGASVYGVVGAALMLILTGAVLLAERRRKLES